MWGGGHISETLRKYGYVVCSTDVVNRDYTGQTATADFLQRQEPWHGDIITNPPYKYAAEFVNKALELIEEGKRIAMFLKLTFLEGEKRRNLFKNNPPVKIYVFTKRVNCAWNGNEAEFSKSSAICYAWFIWEKGNRQKPVIDWI